MAGTYVVVTGLTFLDRITNGLENDGIHSLPVAQYLPSSGYLSILRGDLKKPEVL